VTKGPFGDDDGCATGSKKAVKIFLERDVAFNCARLCRGATVRALA